MRLTHSVTIRDPHQPNNVEATVHPSEHVHDLPICIKRANNELWLSWDEFNAIADLVWAHRADSAIKDAEIVGDHCPARTPRSDYGCILKAGHLPVLGGQWTHINRDAYKWNDEPHMHEWEDSGPDTPPGGELCKHCGAARIVR